MHQIPGLFIAQSPLGGRGVFSSIPISKGEMIEICPIIIIPSSELPVIHRSILHDYYFLWGKDLSEAAIALGFGSLYNHAVNPNADFILDLSNQTIDIVCISTINAGEEITLNYHGEAGDDKPLWFTTL